MDNLDVKLNQFFPGKVVRKDLTKQIKEGINVPIYVLEYLLGMYCATDDEETIKDGIIKVKEILSQNYVRPDEAEKVKSKIKEKGKYKIIDKVTVKLNDKLDRYEGFLSALGLKNLIVDNSYVRKYEKLLAGGIWCILTIEYQYDESSHDSPFLISELKPIQMPGLDLSEYIDVRKNFTLTEWMDVICRSVGMEPVNLTEQVKWHIVARMIPFVEKNYNICELGPRGTGKSYVYDEISPYSILISGGQTTVANLFYNMSSRTIGLVGLWDVVAFDEVAGINLKDKDGIQIMKGFMANGSFSRGKESINADASMVFVGNINGSIENLVKTSHLLVPFPKEMIDTAFFDRFHHYLPGWEVPKMRPEFFTNNYGFITDYFSECLRELKKQNFSDAIFDFFRLGKDLNQRDTIAVKRTVSGLIKLLFPDGNYTKEDVQKCLEYALVGRRRVKEQLKKIGGMEFYDVHFSYIDLADNEEHFVRVPESGGKSLIPEGDLPNGTVYSIAQNTESGHKGLFRLDLQKMSGNGKISDTGFGGGTAIKEELKEAINYVRSNLSRVTQLVKYSDYEYHLKASDLNGIGNIRGLELAIFLSIVSGLTGRSLLPQLIVLGSMSIGGSIIGSDNLADYLQVAQDSGAKKILLPAVDVNQFGKVPADLIASFSLLIYNDPVDAAFKAMGLQ
jgi:ATP-dependent Lon protease